MKAPVYPVTAWLLLLAACAGVPGGPAAARRPIFRYVETSAGRIELDQPWQTAPILDAPHLDAIIALPPRAFGGAQAIRIHRAAAGVVRRVDFDYAQDADFDAMVADYTRSLGPPVRYTEAASPQGADRAVWEDARTRFELIRDFARNVSTVYSVLSSRAAGA